MWHNGLQVRQAPALNLSRLGLAATRAALHACIKHPTPESGVQLGCWELRMHGLGTRAACLELGSGLQADYKPITITSLYHGAEYVLVSRHPSVPCSPAHCILAHGRPDRWHALHCQSGVPGLACASLFHPAATLPAGLQVSAGRVKAPNPNPFPRSYLGGRQDGPPVCRRRPRCVQGAGHPGGCTCRPGGGMHAGMWEWCQGR